MTKKIFLFGLLMLLQASLFSQEFHNGIAAKVNGTVITTFDIFKMTGMREAAVRKQIADPEEAFKAILKLRAQALQQLIENQLILDEFQDLGARVPTQLVDSQLESLIAKEAKGDRAVFLTKLDEMGLTLAEYRKKIEDNVAVEMMVSENVARKAFVTDEEVAQYYSNNHQEFSSPVKLHLKVFLLNSKDVSSAKNVAFKKAIDENKSFAELAKLVDYSKDMGLLSAKDIRADFVKHCASVAEGKLSPVLLSEERCYYFQLVKREGGELRIFDATLQKQLKGYLLRKEEGRLYKEYVAKLRRNANVVDMSQK